MNKINLYIKAFILYTFIILAIYCSPINLHAEIINSISVKDLWYLEDINSQKGWDYLSTYKKDFSKPTIVAVIDTGADYSHPLINNALWTNTAELYGTEGVDDDGNGYIDDIYGINTYNHNSSPIDDSTSSIKGHGTHVAGTILLSSGVTMTKNPFNIKVMILKAGDSYGNFSDINTAEAIRYAADNGASVINMSLSTSKSSPILQNALEYAAKSAVLIASAGNKGYPTSDSGFTSSKDYFPAGYPYIVGVMSHNRNHTLSSFSNWDYIRYSGAEYDICAPGENIFSCYYNSAYKSMNGTSMSTGIVSGCAALLCAKYNNNIYTMSDLTSHLIESCNENISYTDLHGKGYKFRSVDLYKLLSEDIMPKLIIDNEYKADTDANGKSIKLIYTIKNRGCSAANISTSISCDNGYDMSYTYQKMPETKMDSFAENTTICNIAFSNTLPKNTTINLNIHVTYNNGACTSDKKVYSGDYSIPVNTGNIPDTVETNIPLQGITISSPSIITLKKGASTRLNISYIPENTTDDRTITFSSSNPKILKTDCNGLITGLSKGSALVTVSSSKGHKRTITVIVYSQEKKDISTLPVSLSGTKFNWNGRVQKPKISIKGLIKNIDYTIQYSNSLSKKPGTYTITIKGKGNYTGKIIKKYTIISKTKFPKAEHYAVGFLNRPLDKLTYIILH